MLEQTPPMTQSPWDGSNNQQLFQFPPASSASTTDSYAPRYDTIEETDDTPDWLGGPLTEDLNMVEAPTQRLEQPYQQAQQRYQQPYHHPRQAYPSFDPSASAEFGDLTSPLPFRRHSLAHEPLLSQPQQQSLLMRLSEKRASLSGASPSSSILSAPWSNTSNQNRYNTSTKKEAFGSTIWSATNSPSATQTSFLWDQGTTSSPSYAPSPTSASSSLFPRAQLHSLSEQSVFPTHGVFIHDLSSLNISVSFLVF
ncbi:hypothetical protein BCR43DRAFT_292922 [Syncephalastrum racemosum]|uniref:Uncharacterized protein n=1 Tax=Syncephalastrum racemosum TaxID=13706 RepID=A0A1X2HDQ0_SYNRA|nr:hypothetical protein BCR43DRAFT_292922 [Syncephalastrum racemosum]